MPFQIIRSDITEVKADAIVNSANPEPRVGRGSDMAVYRAAGFEKLLAEREKIGAIAPGEAAVTDAFDLSAKYIIHTVGPLWIDGLHNETETLASCYRKCLNLAKHLKCESIAFPLISTGVYGFPKDQALNIALREIQSFLDDEDMDVILAVFDRQAYQLSRELNLSVRAYIDDHMAASLHQKEYDMPYTAAKQSNAPKAQAERRQQSSNVSGMFRKKKKPVPLYDAQIRENASIASTEMNLDDILRTHAKTFQEQLLGLIDEKGMTDVQVYKKANIDRKLFSKIRSNKDYVPRKKTALALAAALELDMEQTKDLLARASLALSPSSPFDLIIEYCITHKIYSIYDINAILFEYDQQLLGG